MVLFSVSKHTFPVITSDSRVSSSVAVSKHVTTLGDVVSFWTIILPLILMFPQSANNRFPPQSSQRSALTDDITVSIIQLPQYSLDWIMPTPTVMAHLQVISPSCNAFKTRCSGIVAYHQCLASSHLNLN